MKKSIKDEWVRRLRSGNYPQGVRELNGRDGYCCLGVLCEIAADEGEADRHPDPETNRVAYGGTGESHTSPFYLTSKLIEWAAFDPDPDGDPNDGDPYLVINGRRLRATTHNDQGATFAEIADAIERDIPEDDEDES